MPGLFGSLASVVVCAIIHDPSFHPVTKSTQAQRTRTHLYVRIDAHAVTMNLIATSIYIYIYRVPVVEIVQALNQLAATFISLTIALVGGALTGLLVKMMGKQFNLGITDTHFFVDAAYWSNTEGYSVYNSSKPGGKYLPSAESDVSNRSMGNSHSTKVAPMQALP